MTERRLRQRFCRRPEASNGALLALSGLLVFHAPPLSGIAPLAKQPPGAGIGLIAAIGVSVTVGVVLVAYLVRPLIMKLTAVQPREPAEHEDTHRDRWARWEASKSQQPGEIGSQAEGNAMIGTAMAIDLPPDQTASTGGEQPDRSLAAGISATLSTLLECANDGAMLSGFGLYTDRFFQRFAEESGLSLDEFVRRFQSLGARSPEERLTVARIDSVTTLPDGRISAYIVYSPAGAQPPERYIFSWSTERSRWLIDDIVAEG